jgi:hypothetical protein
MAYVWPMYDVLTSSCCIMNCPEILCLKLINIYNCSCFSEGWLNCSWYRLGSSLWPCMPFCTGLWDIWGGSIPGCKDQHVYLSLSFLLLLGPEHHLAFFFFSIQNGRGTREEVETEDIKVLAQKLDTFTYHQLKQISWPSLSQGMEKCTSDTT